MNWNKLGTNLVAALFPAAGLYFCWWLLGETGEIICCLCVLSELFLDHAQTKAVRGLSNPCYFCSVLACGAASGAAWHRCKPVNTFLLTLKTSFLNQETRC